MLDFTHTPAEHMDSLEQENDLSLGAPLGLSHSSPGSWRRVRWALQGHHARERLAIIIVDLLALGRINADMIERPILAPDIARETIVRVGRVYAKLPLASIIRSLVSFPGLDTDMIIRIDLTPDIAILTEGIGGRDHLELDRPLAGGILAGCHIDGIDLMRLDREFERRQALRGGWVKSRRQHLGEGTHVIGRQRDPVAVRDQCVVDGGEGDQFQIIRAARPRASFNSPIWTRSWSEDRQKIWPSWIRRADIFGRQIGVLCRIGIVCRIGVVAQVTGARSRRQPGQACRCVAREWGSQYQQEQSQTEEEPDGSGQVFHGATVLSVQKNDE